MNVSTGPYGRRHVLLIDDSDAERNFYQAALGHEFDISTAGRGSEGIVLAAQQHPDVIVLDVMMPGMDGWETCTQIKCHSHIADIPVILLTGADDVDLSQHAMAVGASALLQKPCAADRLREMIVATITEPRSRLPRV